MNANESLLFNANESLLLNANESLLFPHYNITIVTIANSNQILF